MRRRTISIYISSKLLEYIDKEAKEKNRSRSNFIETILEYNTNNTEHMRLKISSFQRKAHEVAMT